MTWPNTSRRDKSSRDTVDSVHGVSLRVSELELNIHDNLESLRKWAHHPPKGKDDYLEMLRDLADDEYVIVHLPNGVGKIPVKVGMIDQEIEKLL